MSTKKENKIRTVKFISLIVLLFSFGFGSIALAAVTISSTGITGDSSFNTITGVVSSTIDVGSGQTLSLQTVGNGPINTGSGTFTVNGSLTLAGISGSTQCLHVNSSGVISGTGSDCGAGGGSGLTVGTTAITGGTNGRVEYNNSGVVGEMTTSGTGTVLALTASPTFTGTVTTPALTISGIASGAQCLQVNGSGVVSGTGSACGSGGGGGSLTVGTTAITGGTSGNVQYNNAGVLGEMTTTGSGTVLALATSPTFVTPTLGAATTTTINKLTITTPAAGSTLTIANGKTLTANNSLTLAGTDGTTMTFPSTSATIARTDAANTFTGVQTFSSAPTFSSIASGTQCLQVNGSGVVSGTGSVCGSGGGSGLTVGTTAITSGTSGRVEYNNAGVLGEMTTSGSGTTVALTTSPVFTTPTLGVATATTLNGNTFTTGTYTLTGTAGKTLTFNNSITLAGTDGTTMTFPSTSASLAPLASPTFTGTATTPALTISGIASGTQCLQVNGSGVVSGTGSVCGSGGGSGLTVGTTAITSGTSGRVEYNNAGVLGEMTTSGSGTTLALTTSPTFTTPNLGTPSTLVGTNITGTAASLTAGITNALASATTTVNVSSATAPTTGQVLTATSGTAATWQTPSGGSGVSVTTKGDLQGFDTAADRIPVGPDGDVLTADSTQALGLKWAAAPGVSISQLSAPVGSATYTMGIYNLTFNGINLSGTSNFLSINDLSSNTSTGYGIDVNLTSGSSMKPAEFVVNGNGVSVSNAGVLAPKGTGHINADESSGFTLTGITGSTQCLQVNSAGLVSGTGSVCGSGGGSGLTVGTTAITSGTSGRVEYNNAGVLGEMTTSGSGTTVALTTSPVFTTPTLGVATATTLNGNTFTTGTYTLTGTAGKTLTFNNSITLAGTDGTTMTFPSTSASLAPLASPTFTGTATTPALTISGIASGTQCLQVNGSGVVSGTGSVCGSGGGSGLTVATTTITGGTSGGIEYNNAGVLGEMTTSGSGTVVALTVSPTFTTPNLGAATATGLTLSGITGSTQCLHVNSSGVISGTGSDCGSAGGSSSWNSITNPSGNQALTMAANTTTWTYNATTGSGTNMFNITDTASNTGTGSLVNISTATGSAAIPLTVAAVGSNAFQVLSSGQVKVLTAGAASTAALNVTGAPYTAGSATTDYPLAYLNDGTAPTTWSTSGTEFGINAPSGFVGNFVDFHLNGGASVYSISSAGVVTANNTINPSDALTVASNAVTVPVGYKVNTITNNANATVTITMTTAGAVDGQLSEVRFYDVSGTTGSQTLAWNNTENSTTVSCPLASNNSNTSPVTVGLQYNGQTSKWRCIALSY